MENMEKQGDQVIASELDYHQYNYSYPIYKHSKILPLAGSQTVNVTNAGGAESLFEIPSKVINLSHSFLSFNITPVSSGGGNFNWTYADLIGNIRQIQLYTRGGLFLCDINNFDNFTKCLVKAEVSLDEFLSFDKSDVANGYLEGIRANNDLVSANGSKRYNNENANVNYIENKYTYVGTVAAATPIILFKIPLSLFVDTIFSLDRDLFFDEVIVMRIVWNAPSKYMWFGTSASNPTTGAAIYAGGVTITALTLFTAIETNQDIVNGLRAKKNSAEGINVLMPYVYSNKINLTGTQQSISLRYNRAHGMKLLKVFHQPINNTESVNTAYDADNTVDGGLNRKISSFYTLLNNVRLQEFNVDCYADEDSMLLRNVLEGSMIVSKNMYQYNWFWCDDFSGSPSKLHKINPVDFDNCIKGLDLSTEQKWDIFLTVKDGAQLNHYTFAVTQRLLNVGPNGIQIM